IGRMNGRAWVQNSSRIGALFFLLVFGVGALSYSSQSPSPAAQAGPGAQSAVPQALPTTPATTTTQGLPQTIPPAMPRAGLNVVVLDPAHGGTDLGARGTGGIRESEIVLDF